MIESLTITEVRETGTLLQVFGTVAGRPVEITAFKGGAFELYTFPTEWGGHLPRFQHYLPAEQGDQVVTALRTGGWLRPSGGYSYVLRGGVDGGRVACLDLDIPVAPAGAVLPAAYEQRFVELGE